MQSLSRLHSLILTPDRLRREGLDPNRVTHWVSRGILTRVRHGVYVRTEDLDGLRHEDRHRLAILAYAAAARSRPVFCRESAALLHGFALLSPPRRIHVLSGGAHGHRAKDVSVHRPKEAAVEEIAGLRATDVVSTLVDCALGLPRDEALVVIESALWASRCGGDGFPDLAEERTALETEVLERLGGETRRGARSAQSWAALIGSLSESPGESATKAVLWDHRLPKPVQQYRIGTHRTDFAWPDQKVILEFDGETKYAEDAHAAAVVRAERRRQQYLADAGWTVVRTTWEEVRRRPLDLIEKLRRAGV